MGTMLHEVSSSSLDTLKLTSHGKLTHNVHGPHDDKFYSFLSKLQDEYEELRRKGYAGEGFFTPGQRLGGSVAYINGRALSNDASPALGRLKALEAAEKRRQVSRVLGGQRTLGGASGSRAGGPGRGLTPRELAARVRCCFYVWLARRN